MNPFTMINFKEPRRIRVREMNGHEYYIVIPSSKKKREKQKRKKNGQYK